MWNPKISLLELSLERLLPKGCQAKSAVPKSNDGSGVATTAPSNCLIGCNPASLVHLATSDLNRASISNVAGFGYEQKLSF